MTKSGVAAAVAACALSGAADALAEERASEAPVDAITLEERWAEALRAKESGDWARCLSVTENVLVVKNDKRFAELQRECSDEQENERSSARADAAAARRRAFLRSQRKLRWGLGGEWRPARVWSWEHQTTGEKGEATIEQTSIVGYVTVGGRFPIGSWLTFAIGGGVEVVSQSGFENNAVFGARALASLGVLHLRFSETHGLHLDVGGLISGARIREKVEGEPPCTGCSARDEETVYSSYVLEGFLDLRWQLGGTSLVSGLGLSSEGHPMVRLGVDLGGRAKSKR